MAYCDACGRLMDVDTDPTSRNEEGTCLSCKAKAGNIDAISEMANITSPFRGPDDTALVTFEQIKARQTRFNPDDYVRFLQTLIDRLTAHYLTL